MCVVTELCCRAGLSLTRPEKVERHACWNMAAKLMGTKTIVAQSWLVMSKTRERFDRTEWPYRTSKLMCEAGLFAGNKTEVLICVLTEIVARSWLELSEAKERVDE